MPLVFILQRFDGDTVIMNGNNEMEMDGPMQFRSYKALYCDEILEMIEAAGQITGKKNGERASKILGILEAVEGRMREGECSGMPCPRYAECFR